MLPLSIFYLLLSLLLSFAIHLQHFKIFILYVFVCRFWEAVQQLKALPQSEVQDKVTEIWTEFLAPDASCPINVDSRSYEITKKNMEAPDRWSFDAAAVSIKICIHLSKSSQTHTLGSSEMIRTLSKNFMQSF